MCVFCVLCLSVVLFGFCVGVVCLFESVCVLCRCLCRCTWCLFSCLFVGVLFCRCLRSSCSGTVVLVLVCVGVCVRVAVC